jgi:ribosomal protein L18E
MATESVRHQAYDASTVLVGGSVLDEVLNTSVEVEVVALSMTMVQLQIQQLVVCYTRVAHVEAGCHVLTVAL